MGNPIFAAYALEFFSCHAGLDPAWHKVKPSSPRRGVKFLYVEASGENPFFELSSGFAKIQDNISKVRAIWLYIGILCLYFLVILIIKYFSNITQYFQFNRKLIAIFFISVLLASYTSKYIELPYSNPWSVLGPMTEAKYNPSNDIIRYLYIILMPVAALLLLRLFTNIKRVSSELTPSIAPYSCSFK